MWNIAQQIIQSGIDYKFDIIELPDFHDEDLISRVVSKYCKPGTIFPIWERVLSYGSLNNSESWKWIDKFIGDSEAILFFDPFDEKKAFLFKNGYDLVSAIGETYNVEFYVINATIDYLICFNHHDFLIVCGNAYEWFKKEGLIDEISV